MADALVSVILEQLSLIIAQKVQKEVGLVADVKNEVRKLESNFQAIQAVLADAEQSIGTERLANDSTGGSSSDASPPKGFAASENSRQNNAIKSFNNPRIHDEFMGVAFMPVDRWCCCDIRKTMAEARIRKVPACSLIDCI
uniref:Disease resistance N-terminal domain-containing protein n=1 Tax=Salix viminalis TaxID=40686 RepID=A0A6N2NID6_SALVM